MYIQALYLVKPGLIWIFGRREYSDRVFTKLFDVWVNT